jgi:hypothetical protein
MSEDQVKTPPTPHVRNPRISVTASILRTTRSNRGPKAMSGVPSAANKATPPRKYFQYLRRRFG